MTDKTPTSPRPQVQELVTRAMRAVRSFPLVAMVHRGRQMELLRESGLFDVDYYNSQLGDGAGADDAYQHYVVSGHVRGLSPHPLFDPDYYVAANRRAAASPAPPFVHFADLGAADGLDPHPLFDSAAYEEQVPEAADHPYGAFGHYVGSGEAVPGGLDLGPWAEQIESPRHFGRLARAAWQRYSEDPDYRDFDRLFDTFDHAGGADFVRRMSKVVDALGSLPVVSVVLPTKDRRDTVGDAIQSVVDQTYPAWELVIVDDGGTDGTEGLVRERFGDDDRITYVHQSNTGVAGARNTGIRRTTGDYVAYLDSDNTWTPEFLRTMVGFLTTEQLRAGYAASELRDDTRRQYRGRPLDVGALRERNYIDCITIVHERSLLNETGMFDARLRRVVDWDLLIRFAEHTELGYAPFIATSYDVWDERGERITMQETAGYRFVVRAKHLLEWDGAPPTVDGRTSVVVTTTTGDLRALPMLDELGKVDDVEIILVDNALPTREGVALRVIEQLNSKLRVDRLVDCGAVPVARNLAATRASGDVICFVDDAVALTAYALRALEARVRGTGEIAQPVIADDANLVVSAGLGVAPGGHVAKFGLGLTADDELHSDVVGVEGFILAAPSRLIRLLEGFDPIYVHGLGDFDLSLRAAAHGSRPSVLTDIVCYLPDRGPIRLWSPGPDDLQEFHKRWTLEQSSTHGVTVHPVGWSRVASDRSREHPARWQPVLGRVPGSARRWSIRTRVPGMSVAASWGDWHFANALAEALRSAGEHVVVDTPHSIGRATAHLTDVVLTLRGTKPTAPQPGACNVLWLISHPDRVTRAELNEYDLVFVASEPFAEFLRREWGVEHARPLLQCTDPSRFYPEPVAGLAEPLLFVGNSRNVYRTAVRDTMEAGLELIVYGQGWEQFLPASRIGGEYLPNEELHRHYSSADVVLNDHWEDMRRRGFLSNRLFDAAASGAVVVTDRIPGLDIFEGRVLPYDDPADLPQVVAEARAMGPDEACAERIRKQHSFAARVATLRSAVDDFTRQSKPREQVAVRPRPELREEAAGATDEPERAPTHGPVFVGGTGRSGTTIVGRLVGAAAPYTLVPVEARFHCDPVGLADVLAGHAAPAQFATAVRERWYQRKPNANGMRGLHVICAWADLEPLLADFVERSPASPQLAAAALLDGIFGRVARRAGSTSYVEMTPPVVKAGHELARALPDARFIHVVRDGRDVASSVTGRGWGPNQLDEALVWWGDEMLEIHRGTRNLGPERLLVMRMESLVGQDRDDAFTRLSEFLSLSGDRSMEEFLEREFSGDRAHLGRWKVGLEQPAEVDRIQALYERQLARLAEQGVDFPQL